MRQIFLPGIVLLMALSPVSAEDPSKKNSKKDREQLLGVWDVVEMTENGKDQNDELTRKLMLKLVLKENGGMLLLASMPIPESPVFSWKLVGSHSPGWIDLTEVTANETQVIRAIYKLEKDKLTLVSHSDKKEQGKRPKAIQSGKGLSYMVLKREK